MRGLVPDVGRGAPTGQREGVRASPCAGQCCPEAVPDPGFPAWPSCISPGVGTCTSVTSRGLLGPCALRTASVSQASVLSHWPRSAERLGSRDSPCRHSEGLLLVFLPHRHLGGRASQLHGQRRQVTGPGQSHVDRTAPFPRAGGRGSCMRRMAQPRPREPPSAWVPGRLGRARPRSRPSA